MAEGNRWDIRHVYLYLVCFATLIMLIVGTVGLINGLVEVIYPNPYLGSKITPYDIQQRNSNIPPEEINEQTEEEQRLQEASMKRSTVIRIVNSAALIFVSLPIYIYHWRKVRLLT